MSLRRRPLPLRHSPAKAWSCRLRRLSLPRKLRRHRLLFPRANPPLSPITGGGVRNRKLPCRNPLLMFRLCNPASVQARPRHWKAAWLSCNRILRSAFKLSARNGCRPHSEELWKARAGSFSNLSGRFNSRICSGPITLPTKPTFWLIRWNSPNNHFSLRPPGHPHFQPRRMFELPNVFPELLS